MSACTFALQDFVHVFWCRTWLVCVCTAICFVEDWCETACIFCDIELSGCTPRDHHGAASRTTEWNIWDTMPLNSQRFGHGDSPTPHTSVASNIYVNKKLDGESRSAYVQAVVQEAGKLKIAMCAKNVIDFPSFQDLFFLSVPAYLFTNELFVPELSLIYWKSFM